VHVIREQPFSVELYDGYELAVGRLQVGVAGDIDLAQLEPELRLKRRELLPRPLAEVAPRRGEERQLRDRYLA
jgi:hypothetical protein